MYDHAFRLTADWSVAEDVMSATFLGEWWLPRRPPRKLRRLKSPTSVVLWVAEHRREADREPVTQAAPLYQSARLDRRTAGLGGCFGHLASLCVRKCLLEFTPMTRTCGGSVAREGA